jgi:hypothetical protein
VEALMPEWDEQGNLISEPAGQEWDEQGNPVSLASPNQPVPGHPAERLASGMVRGGLNAINPVEWVKSAAALGKLGLKAAFRGPTSVTGELSEIGHGLAATGRSALAGDPETIGELAGGALAAPIPMGRIAAGVAKRVPLFRPTEASRAYNIRRALRLPAGRSEVVQKLTSDVNRMAPEIDLPVTASHRKLTDKLIAERETAGAAVDAAEAAVPPRDIPIADVTSRLEPPSGQWTMRNDVMEFVPDSPEALRAHNAAVESLEAAAGDTGTISARDLVSRKAGAQKVAREKGSYQTEDVSSSKGVLRAKASAIRATLEAQTGSEFEALSRANRAAHVLKTIEKPVRAEATRLGNLSPVGRGTEILLGRAGAAGWSGPAGPIGALAGLAGGQILDSTLFHTASARVKGRIIEALNSGQPQLATDILFRSALVDAQARRAAERELAAQGEGVTTP